MIQQYKPGSTAERVRKIEEEQRKLNARKAEEKRKERIETRRFWITTFLAGIAALAGVAGLLLQLCQ
jgi:hypothetical protein